MHAHPLHFHPRRPDNVPVVEGIGRVVAVDGDSAWLEPEQTTSCGHCSASGACASAHEEAPGLGTVASRMQARRFRIDARSGLLRVGDRVVVGIGPRALLKGALLAYGLPLVAALTGGGLAQERYASDGLTLLGMLGGLAAGLLLARLFALRLAAHGALSPYLLRHARPDETCQTL